MRWLAWFLMPDAWLSNQILSEGGVWGSMFLAIASLTLSTITTSTLFIVLAYFVKRDPTVWSCLKRFIGSALARREGKGQRMAEYLTKWRYRYILIFLLNIVPYIPSVTAATIFYGAVTRDKKSLLVIWGGLILKAVMLTVLLGIARSLMNGQRA
jgi:hypothetical protein